MSDDKGARCLLPALPNASKLIADRGYNTDWLSAALKKNGITPCILPTAQAPNTTAPLPQTAP